MLVSTMTAHLAKKYGLKAAVSKLIDAGYTAIDVSMCELDKPPYVGDYRALAEELLDIAGKAGVKFIQAHAPFGGYEDFMNNIKPRLPRAFEFCGLLGISNIVVHPILPCDYYGNEEKLFNMNVEFYRSLAPLAKEHGVKIALENMWGFHPKAGLVIEHFCADPKELARLYDVLDDPECFTVCLDFGHVALCKREPEDAIRIIGGERLGCIHAHDVDYRQDLHMLPGTVKLNWDEICRALAEVNYKGAFNLEADGFYKGFFDSQCDTVTKFMADIATSMAERVEYYRNK